MKYKIRLLISSALASLSFQVFAQDPVLNAENGLNATGTGTGRKVLLGGSLTNHTTIDFGAYNLNFTGTGNVGIRTASPQAPLHVYKHASGNFNPVMILEDGLADGYVMFQMKGTGRTYHLGLGNASESYFGLANKFFIWDQNVGAARVVVDPDGNVGIGTNSPASKLSVAGTITSTAFKFNGLNNTATPVAGNGKVLSVDANGNLILVNDATGSSTAWGLTGNAGTTSGTNFVGTTDAQDLVFKVNNAERMRITSNTLNTTSIGQVSFETLSRSNDRIRIGKYHNLNDGQNNVISTSSDGGVNWRSVIVERDGAIGIGGPGANSWNVGSPSIRITPTGLVSINSQNWFFGHSGGPYNSSALMFNVSNANEWNNGNDVYPEGQNSYYMGTILQAPNPSTNKRAPLKIAGRMLQFMTGGSVDVEAMRLTESGNMLVGTTTDNSNKLQVNGTVSATGFVLPTGAGAGKVLTSDATGVATWQTATGGSGSSGWGLSGNASLPAGSFIGTSGAQEVLIKANNTEVIRIGTGGNIGIGTPSLALNSAAYKLNVEGSIRSRKVRVDQATWADFVFEKDYSLITLAELEKFIQKNRHLPDVPSAAEVAKDGVDLGDNQAVLLKKIEELTLYVIEQNKKIEALEKKVNGSGNK